MRKWITLALGLVGCFGAMADLTKMTGSQLQSAAISPDNRYLFTGGFDDFLNVWDIETQERVAQAKIESPPVFSMAFVSPETLVLATNSPPLKMRWKDKKLTPLGEYTFSVAGHSSTTGGSLVASADKKWFVASGLRELAIWDVEKDSPIMFLGPHENWFFNAEVSKDKRRLFASTSHSGTSSFMRYSLERGVIVPDGQLIPSSQFDGSFTLLPSSRFVALLEKSEDDKNGIINFYFTGDLSLHHTATWGKDRPHRLSASPSGQYLFVFGKQAAGLLEVHSGKWILNRQLDQTCYEGKAVFNQSEDRVFVACATAVEAIDLKKENSSFQTQTLEKMSLDALWVQLGTGADAAFLVQHEFLRRGEASANFLLNKIALLPTTPLLSQNELDEAVRNLGDDSFLTRQAASDLLRKSGFSHSRKLREIMKSTKSAEVRSRIRRLFNLWDLDSDKLLAKEEDIRLVRVLHILKKLNLPSCVARLKQISEGNLVDYPTQIALDLID